MTTSREIKQFDILVDGKGDRYEVLEVIKTDHYTDLRINAIASNAEVYLNVNTVKNWVIE